MVVPKFRAWDKELKTILDVSLIDFKKRVLVGEHWEFGETNFISFDDIYLMQSTGLFDKHNKEIFEGDVVLVLDSPYTVFYDNERGSYRLKPHDDRWNVDYMSNFSHGGNFEVVGNIYENKEYL
nr:MAG TPA: YopX protein [Caudoviricetes sp.]